MQKEIKTAVNRMQLVNTLGIEEHLVTYVDGVSGLWIPPSEGALLTRWCAYEDCDLRITEACLILNLPSLLKGDFQERKKIQGIWYTIPDRLQIDLEQGNDPDILLNGSIGFHQSLAGSGWRYNSLRPTESKTLVKEFLNLAELALDCAGEAVRKFVLRWGPLWLCTNHADCCWTPPSYSNSNPFNIQRQCRWFPSEPVIVFLARAKQAKAAIEIAGFLSENQHAPMEYWRTLSGQRGVGYESRFPDGSVGRLDGKGKADLWVQQNHLIREINRFLTIANGPSFRLAWSRKQGHPVMVQDTGLGFFRLVWLQIAQSICGGKGIFKCDACGRYFIPNRKPREGENHFCLSCGKNKAAAKRIWARHNRKVKSPVI